MRGPAADGRADKCHGGTGRLVREKGDVSRSVVIDQPGHGERLDDDGKWMGRCAGPPHGLIRAAALYRLGANKKSLYLNHPHLTRLFCLDIEIPLTNQALWGEAAISSHL